MEFLLMQEGFWFHHAEPNYLMLVCWLPDIKHTIPINASHRVGIGALVMNDKREVLQKCCLCLNFFSKDHSCELDIVSSESLH